METQLLIAAGALVVAGIIAALLRRRQRSAVPTQPRHRVPAQLDRADFPSGATPWLVVVFSSSSCHACADVVRKAAVLACGEVGVIDVEYTAQRDVHVKYGIDAVPMVLIVDRQGVVHASFVGPVSATDLWAAVAVARDPAAQPGGAACARHEPSAPEEQVSRRRR